MERAVTEALGGEMACRFGGVDITRPLADEANRALAAALPSARLLIASYVVAENARALEASGFAFFESLFRDAADGTTLLVLETTHRSFGEIVAAARRGGGSGLLVDCPWVGSNGGHSLLLCKDASAVADDEGVRALLERFERDRREHARGRRARDA